MDYIDGIVVKIRRNNSDNFKGHSAGSTGWFNLDCEWLKETFYTLEPDFYKKLLKSILKVNILKHIKLLYYLWIILNS